MVSLSRDPEPLPEHWLRCPRKAGSLLTNKFLVFKTPLDEKFDDQVPLKHRFTPAILFNSVQDSRQILGLWIDLTDTTRFYNKEFIKEKDCKYVKIECQENKVPPSIEQTNVFVSICKKFISRNPLNIIGVHCTHGYNRTGFLLVSFLVEVYDYSVDVAIKQFAKVRPPGIYEEHYINVLFQRYDDIDYTLPAPPLPEWCNGSAAKKCSAQVKSCTTFVEGIKGVEPIIDTDEGNRIREKVKLLAGYECDSFIGSEPISMNRNNMLQLSEKPYLVSWKADGYRYIMFIENKDNIFFLDKNNTVFKIHNLQFFSRKCSTQQIENTLIDGEMVIDKIDGKKIPRYLIFDMIIFENEKVAEKPFSIRMQRIREEILEPREKAKKEFRIITEQEPFSMRYKRFYDIQSAISFLDKSFVKRLPHTVDGLIFQPRDDPYTPGNSPMILKWKPSCRNSIDFRLRVNTVENPDFKDETFGNLLTSSGNCFGKIKCDRTLCNLNDKIIECSYQNNRWIYVKERKDKSIPNCDQTAEAVYHSIQHPVTKEMLLDFINNCKWNDPMPPPRMIPSPRTSQ